MGILEPADVVLEEMRGWPRRTALLVGDRPQPKLVNALHALGFSTAVAPLINLERVAALASPFTFCMMSPEVLDGDSVVERLVALRRYSPSARFLLDAPVDERAPEVLVRAMRAGVVDVIDGTDAGAVENALAAGLSALGLHRERVLAVGAHPDDVEIGCAGTLLDHRLRGDRVSILTLSRGSVGGDQFERLREADTAAEAIGAQLIFGDLPDTCIDEGVSTIRLIEEVVRLLQPTVVYVHSQHDNHQDHRAVSRATASATRQVRRVYGYQSPSATNEYRPTKFLPVDHVLQRKVQVLKMFTSQNGRSYLEPELVVAGSRYWARHLGANARYAEPFEVIRSVGDLRQSSTADSPITGGQLAFGLPAYDAGAGFRPRIV
ncbi:PIG-L deacetylase family protein [uncultured Jatrophihabitans sp.]|uniref:PIG-L deacetylase family protein n=1 Tax=uncultured Jatrophihabitans sp. TaxID=1610747 RepID=UPI0035CBACE1